jgi:predicted PurR-regulated permease PerM
VVDRLEAFRIPRFFASVAVVLSLMGATGVTTMALWPQVEAVVSDIPEGMQRLRSTLRRSRSQSRSASALGKVQEAAKAIDQAAAESAEAPPAPRGTLRVEVTDPWRASDWLWAGGVGILGLAGQATTVLFLTIFLLNENDSFKRKLVRQMETRGNKRLTVQILNDIARLIERFLWIQAVTSVGVAIGTGLALWWLGVEQPAVWGAFAGLLNLVPYFGPLIVTVVLTAVGYLQFGTFLQAIQVAGVALLITTLEGNFITPHLLSKAGSLNHVAIFVSIALWSWLWGVPGMLLAVPILMVTKTVCDHVDGLQVVGEFLGD